MWPSHIHKLASPYLSFLGKSRTPQTGLFRFSSNSSIKPNLPLIDTLVQKTQKQTKPLPFQKTAIVVVQHTFPTSVSVLKSFIELGANPKKIFVKGKSYSECTDAIQGVEELGVHYQRSSTQIGLGGFYRSFTRDINSLLEKCLANIEADDNLLILDHGGNALASITSNLLLNRRVVGIEKTTAGIVNPEVRGLPFPIIRVADCVAKKMYESPIIAEEIVGKLAPFIPLRQEQLTCGVVGYGAIGKALSEKLLSLGHKVMVYDQDHNKLQNTGKAVATKELVVLVGFADYVFGCTGYDISTLLDTYRLCNRNKTLISCSSEDKEYLTLLQLIQEKYNGRVSKNPFGDVEYQNDMGSLIRILGGGFPRNFDRINEGAPQVDIQLTRAFILGAALQAAKFFELPDILTMVGGYMLDPKMQKFISNEWLKYQPPGRFPEHMIANFQNESWIANNSGGAYKPCDIFDDFTPPQQSTLSGNSDDNLSPPLASALPSLRFSMG